jgi:hypothetical protein
MCRIYDYHGLHLYKLKQNFPVLCVTSEARRPGGPPLLPPSSSLASSPPAASWRNGQHGAGLDRQRLQAQI